MSKSLSRRLFQVLFILGAVLIPSLIIAGFPLWLDAPTRSNPHDPKSAAFLGLPSGGGAATLTPSPEYSPTKTSSPTPAAGSPTKTPTKTNSPTPVVGGACAVTDHLDLQVALANGSPCTGQFPQLLFKIVNNNTSGSVNINTLSIAGWFSAGDTTIDWGAGAGGNDDTWRTTIYDSLAASQGNSSSSYAFTSTGLGATKATLLTFSFGSSVSIPAGGYVIAGTTASGAFCQLDGAANGAPYYWDVNCNNYTGLGGGAWVAGAYHEDPTWMLYESSNPVCEWSDSATKDASTGIPGGGSTCSCPGGASPSPVSSPTPTFIPTFSPTPAAATATRTQTPGGACAVTDHLDLQVAVANGSPCTGQFPQLLFKIVNNNTSGSVNINTLSIAGGFSAGDTTIDWGAGAGGNDDTWRTTIYDSLAASQGNSSSSYAFTSTGLGATKATLLTFSFGSSVSIPAGGYVIAGTTASGAFCQLDGAANGAPYYWDVNCNNYTGLGGGAWVAGAYHEDPTWMLYESSNPVCEWSDSATKDASTGIPGGGATCACPAGAASPTPSFTPAAPSATPTQTPGSGCAVTDHLDLQVAVANGSPCTGQFPQLLFKIVNNNTSGSVNINTLSIAGWFSAGDTTIDWGAGAGGNDDTWRTTIYDSLAASQGNSSSSYAFTSTGLGTTKATLLTFSFGSSVSIPAGGYVIAGTTASGAFCQLDGAANGAPYYWDVNCNNYTGLGGGAWVAGAYHEDPTWMLYESSNPVCEWSDSATKDASTGIPGGGSTCSCP